MKFMEVVWGKLKWIGKEIFFNQLKLDLLSVGQTSTYWNIKSIIYYGEERMSKLRVSIGSRLELKLMFTKLRCGPQFCPRSRFVLSQSYNSYYILFLYIQWQSLLDWMVLCSYFKVEVTRFTTPIFILLFLILKR